MKRIGISIGIVVVIGFLSSPAVAQKDLVETVTRDCKGEIGRYCVDISPGRGRVVACLYAHSDKLSAACGMALVDAAIGFEQTISNLALVAKECGRDLRAYCSKERPGEGRLSRCLNSQKQVSPRCKDALKTGGLNEF